MKPSLLKVLACTECKSPLKVTNETIDDATGEIVGGVLFCTNCSLEYPIIHGVPNMLNE